MSLFIIPDSGCIFSMFFYLEAEATQWDNTAQLRSWEPNLVMWLPIQQFETQFSWRTDIENCRDYSINTTKIVFSTSIFLFSLLIDFLTKSLKEKFSIWQLVMTDPHQCLDIIFSWIYSSLTLLASDYGVGWNSRIEIIPRDTSFTWWIELMILVFIMVIYSIFMYLSGLIMWVFIKVIYSFYLSISLISCDDDHCKHPAVPLCMEKV